MINDYLINLVSESESWKSTLEFTKTIDNIDEYSFYQNYQDYYIELFGKIFDEFNSKNKNSLTLLTLAKGLEIFSNNISRIYFKGINYQNNMLYVGSLYYLASYPTSAYLISNFFPITSYSTEIDKFIFLFLNRNIHFPNKYMEYLKEFLNTGNHALIEQLIAMIDEELDKAFYNSINDYFSFRIAKEILINFNKNNIWNDLIDNSSENIEFWERLVRQKVNSNYSFWDFFPSQKKVLESKILNFEHKSYSIQMPTSSGKTSLCEIIIYKYINNNHSKKVLYLAPFRSLATELKSTFVKRLHSLNITTKTLYGGSITSSDEKTDINNANLLITTPEKLLGIENVMPNILNEFSLIICDEGHLLDSGFRGITYELLLTKLKKYNSENRNFLFLSAIVPNINEVNEWLEGNENSIIKSDYRPTEINFGILRYSRENKDYYLNINPTSSAPKNYIIKNIFKEEDFKYKSTSNRFRKYNLDSIKVKTIALSLKSLNFGTVAIFTTSKYGKSGVVSLGEEAIKQIETLNFKSPFEFSNKTITNQLKEFFGNVFGEEYIITKLIKKGIFIHHGDIPQYFREIIEEHTRNNDVKMIICTSTLAEGVNLPIKTLIVHTSKRFNITSQRQNSILTRDLKNIIGRAGRAGKETSGMVIFSNENDLSNLIKVAEDSSNEPVNGHLYRIIKSITSSILKNGLVLSNELLENQNEAFLELLDNIDLSLIDLITEDIDEKTFLDEIRILLEETFAFYKANESEQENLLKLFSLRGERVLEYINNSKFIYLKNSGANIRIFEDIYSNIKIENKIWKNTGLPNDLTWINFLFSILESIKYIDVKINEFNNHYKTTINLNDLKQIITLWINGKWYKDIANELNIDVSNLLKIFSSLIEYELNVIISNTIRTANSLIEDISEVILEWNLYLIYGVSSKVKLEICKLGLQDKYLIEALDIYLKKESFILFDSSELKSYLFGKRNEIIENLKEKIPSYSLSTLKKILKYNK